MNKRLVMYGGLGLLLLLLLSDSGGGSEDSDFVRHLRHPNTQAYVKNKCLAEVIGMQAPIESKLGYCDCVTSKMSELLLAEEAIADEGYLALLEKRELRKSQRNRRFDLRESELFKVLDNPFERMSLEELEGPRFQEMVNLLRTYYVEIDAAYKKALLNCSNQPTSN